MTGAAVPTPDLIEAYLPKIQSTESRPSASCTTKPSTGSVSPIAAVRKAIDNANHPALYMVDTISGLASLDYRHDEWGVDVTVSGSQKGLMLPPAYRSMRSAKRRWAANKTATLQRSYWDWADMVGPNQTGYFPYTPSTSLLYGLNEAIDMLHEEGLDNIFARHARHGAAARAAVRAMGLDVLCATQDRKAAC